MWYRVFLCNSIIQTGLKFTLYLRLPSNSQQSSCLNLKCNRIIRLSHHCMEPFIFIHLFFFLCFFFENYSSKIDTMTWSYTSIPFPPSLTMSLRDLSTSVWKGYLFTFYSGIHNVLCKLGFILRVAIWVFCYVCAIHVMVLLLYHFPSIFRFLEALLPN